MLEYINDPQFGDCLDLLPKISDNSVDMILADLPFGTTKAKWDSIIDLNKLWSQYNRVIKPNGAILLFAQVPFNMVLGMSNMDMLRYEWIWEKPHGTGHLNAKKMPMKCHENIMVFYKSLPTYNPQKTQGHARKVSTAHHKRNSSTGELYGKCDNHSTYDSTERYPRDVLKFASDKQKINIHSTQKPVALCEYLIKTYTHEDELVLDNCFGSGSTLIAAMNTGRNYIGFENDETIFNKACARISAHKQDIY